MNSSNRHNVNIETSTPGVCFQGERNLEEHNNISINIESDTESTTMESEHLLPHQISHNGIHLDEENINGIQNNNNSNRNWPFSWSRSSERNVGNNLFSHFLNNQLGRQRSHPGGDTRQAHRRVQQQHSVSGAIGVERNTDAATAASQIQIWRLNLNDLLSGPLAPPTEALRSLISTPNTNRPRTLENVRAFHDVQILHETSFATPGPSYTTAAPRLNPRLMARSVSLRDNVQPHTGRQINNNSSQTSLPNILNEDSNPATIMASQLRNSQSNSITPGRGLDIENSDETNDSDQAAGIDATEDGEDDETQQNIDENSVISAVITNFLSHFVRYLPFICLLIVKFIHDHLLEILDLLLLHAIMYFMNKSLRAQVAKLSQKSYYVLIRNFILISFVVGYRLHLASMPADPLGLIIPPPLPKLNSVLDTNAESLNTKDVTAAPADSQKTNNFVSQFDSKSQATVATIQETSSQTPPAQTITLGVLIYYVSVSDIISKLITVLFKILVVMMPITVIRLKAKARLLVLLEYLSQFYRAWAPTHQWLLFLFESYSGLEVMSGFLFSSLYLGAKGFEFVDRGKSLKKAIINFLRNMDTERKPTKSELDAAGALCPICHDSFSSPIILECGHIFCDDCVGTWFRREQTCPMCRAKVNEDPAWQDGSTTYFCQFC